MILNFPDIIILKIVSFLNLPDILNFIQVSNSIESQVKTFKKEFFFCDNEKKINNVFIFDFEFLKNNYEEFKTSLQYIRNNYFIDYTFNDNTYENYICYIDSRNWFIIEYYLQWFSKRQNYEFPDFYEIEFFDENKNYYGTMTDNKPKIVNQEINLSEKLENYVFPNKNYKKKIFKNDFEKLKKVIIF